MRHPEIKSAHKDYAKLLEMGVSEAFLRQLSPKEARELLKGLLYLKELFKEREEV